MKKNKKSRVGSEAQYGPRLVGEILQDYFENSNSPFTTAFRRRLFKDLHPNTEPCVDLKLYTRKPGRLPVGANIKCILVHHSEDGYTCIEDSPEMKKPRVTRRNPVIFVGDCVNVHLLADGTKRLEFNRPRFNSSYTFGDFCLAAAQELVTIARLLGEVEYER